MTAPVPPALIAMKMGTTRCLAALALALAGMGCMQSETPYAVGPPRLQVCVSREGLIGVDGQGMATNGLREAVQNRIADFGLSQGVSISAEDLAPVSNIWPALNVIRDTGVFRVDVCDNDHPEGPVPIFLPVPENSGSDRALMISSSNRTGLIEIMQSNAAFRVNGVWGGTESLAETLMPFPRDSAILVLPTADTSWSSFCELLDVLSRKEGRSVSVMEPELWAARLPAD